MLIQKTDVGLHRYFSKNQYLSANHNYVFGNQEISYMFPLKIKQSSRCIPRLKDKIFTNVIIKYSNLDPNLFTLINIA